MNIKKKIIIGVIGTFVFFGVLGAFLPGEEKSKDSLENNKQQAGETAQNNNEQQEDISEPTDNQEIKTSGFEGFREPIENSGVYSTVTKDGKYSLTYSSLDFLEVHSETFPVDREKVEVNGLKVDVGYNESNEFYKPYEKLAFDFKINKLNYSGEVSSLNSESDKNGLMQTLTKFISEIATN